MVYLLPYLLAIIENDACVAIFLEVLINSPVQVDWDAQIVPCIVKDYLVQFASVSVIVGRFFLVLGILLVDDDLAGIVLVDVEAVFTQIDGQCP